MGDLRARRQDGMARMSQPGRRGTVTKGKDARVACRLKRRPDNQLVGAVDFEAVEGTQDFRRLDAGRPNDEVGPEESSVRCVHPTGIDGGDALTGVHRDVESLQAKRRAMLCREIAERLAPGQVAGEILDEVQLADIATRVVRRSNEQTGIQRGEVSARVPSPYLVK